MCWRYIGNYLIFEELNLKFLDKDCVDKCELFIYKDEF